jgi:hypothetical protein
MHKFKLVREKVMKKLFSALLFAALILGFTGCGEPYSEDEIIELFEGVVKAVKEDKLDEVHDKRKRIDTIYQEAVKNNYKKTVQIIEVNKEKYYNEILPAILRVKMFQGQVELYKKRLEEANKKTNKTSSEYSRIKTMESILQENIKKLEEAEAEWEKVKKKYDIKE